MRPKTLRSYKRTMRAYSTGFGFRSPYQILLDGDFCQAGLEQKIYLKEELPTILSDNTRPLVTECTLQELRDKGSAFTGAVLVAKRFERRRCKHRTPVPSAQCIKEIIAKDNPHNYCVASQDPELRKALREIPGVPLLHIKQNFIVLEPLTQVTRDEIQKREYEKTLPSAKEAEKLKTAKLVVGDKPPEEVAAAAKEEPKPKKKKVKGPNPLSVKKKKKKNP
ncbi:Fcf1-domain-containing protein, partial [Radiomyces spectabilis]|uniref:Fcf1-domain-containing protein n=1 Tax=Radiomyces spectabilis TaxID=64574 RepID=UPI002220201E